MDLHVFVETIGVTLSVIATVGGVLAVFFKLIKKKIKKLFQERTEILKLPAAVHGLGEVITEVRDTQKLFTKELKLNGGGSIKDEVRLLAFEKQLELTDKPFPLCRSNAEGKNILVNAAYMDLVKARDEHALLGNGWKQFIYEDEEVDGADEILANYKNAVATRSPFSFPIKFQAFSDDGSIIYRGKWLCKCRPIGEYQESYVFGSTFSPLDDMATTIAETHNWIGGARYKKIPHAESEGDLNAM